MDSVLSSSFFVPEQIQNSINKLRTEAGLTQQAFAEKIGITRQTVIAMERGGYTPSVLLALKMAKFFKRPVEELFFLSYE